MSFHWTFGGRLGISVFRNLLNQNSQGAVMSLLPLENPRAASAMACVLGLVFLKLVLFDSPETHLRSERAPQKPELMDGVFWRASLKSLNQGGRTLLSGQG